MHGGKILEQIATRRAQAEKKRRDSLHDAGVFPAATRGSTLAWLRKWEPIGVLIAIVALVVTAVQFQFDREVRRVEAAVQRAQLEVMLVDRVLAARAADAQRRGSPEIPTADFGQTAIVEAMVRNGISLAHMDLSSINLAAADLTGADLRGADLSKSILNSAVLSDANFEGANLGGVDLNDAIVDGASFAGANLSNARLGWQIVGDGVFDGAGFADGSPPVTRDLTDVGSLSVCPADFSPAPDDFSADPPDPCFTIWVFSQTRP